MFELGNLIVGKPNNGYRMTSDKALMEVVATFGRDIIDVRILSSTDHPDRVGSVHRVSSSEFVLAVDSIMAPKTEMKELPALNTFLEYGEVSKPLTIRRNETGIAIVVFGSSDIITKITPDRIYVTAKDRDILDTMTKFAKKQKRKLLVLDKLSTPKQYKLFTTTSWPVKARKGKKPSTSLSVNQEEYPQEDSRDIAPNISTSSLSWGEVRGMHYVSSRRGTSVFSDVDFGTPF